MAKKRMFTTEIIESDAFLTMPQSTQNLYFHLNMHADDDGFVNNPISIMNLVKANNDDMNLLIAKKFVLIFEDKGLIVIKHWRLHNYLRSDRYKETNYINEKNQLFLDDKGIYHKENAEKIPLKKEIEVVDDLQDAINEFKKMRKMIKKPLTERAEKRLINKLNELSSDKDEQIRILDQSIVHCWQDVYPLKDITSKKDELPIYDSSINPNFDDEKFNELMKRRSK